MALDIWFSEDIRNALLAANEASANMAAVIAEMTGGPPPKQTQEGQAAPDLTELLALSLRSYREGYKAALCTVALAFGIAPQAITLRPLNDNDDFEILGPAEAPEVPAHDGAALPRSAWREQP